jgi:hypothetical protein
MWDGKSCTSIAKTFLPNDRKLASSTCHVCLATPKEMNSEESWTRPVMQVMIGYSCTVLHMWIRSMEFLINIACRLTFVKIFTFLVVKK